MLEDKLSDEEIRELWAEHFPKRLNDIKSKTLCEIFRLVIERRAADYAQDSQEIVDAVDQGGFKMATPAKTGLFFLLTRTLI